MPSFPLCAHQPPQPKLHAGSRPFHSRCQVSGGGFGEVESPGPKASRLHFYLGFLKGLLSSCLPRLWINIFIP